MNIKFFSLSLLLLTATFSIVTQSLYAQLYDNKVERQSDETKHQSKFRVSIDGGFGYLIASTKAARAQMKSYEIPDEEADRYYREIVLGEQAGASIHYLVNPDVGFGLDYNIFTTKGEVLGYVTSGGEWAKFYGPFKEKIYTSFLGASVFQNQKINEKWNFYGKLSFGVAFYRNESMMIILPALITGNAAALRGELGLSYSINRRFSVNAGISYLFSTLRKIQINDGTNTTEVKLEGDMKENLSRLSVSTGVQFHF